jgi:hypothetical protein
MSALDLNDAPSQREDGPIPDGTIATVQLTVRPGSAGEHGLLKRSKDGACEMLDCEFVVVDGPHTKRKFWENMIITGTTSGHEKAAEISRGKLRAILESARGIKPNDTSSEARKARNAELIDFDGITFVARIGVEMGRPRNDGSGNKYPDRNNLAAVITPDKKAWKKVEQAPRPATPAATNAAAVAPMIAKPVWAQ